MAVTSLFRADDAGSIPTERANERWSDIVLYVGRLTDYPILFCSEKCDYSSALFFTTVEWCIVGQNLVTPGRGLTMHHPGVINNTTEVYFRARGIYIVV